MKKSLDLFFETPKINQHWTEPVIYELKLLCQNTDFSPSYFLIDDILANILKLIGITKSKIIQKIFRCRIGPF